MGIFRPSPGVRYSQLKVSWRGRCHPELCQTPAQLLQLPVEALGQIPSLGMLEAFSLSILGFSWSCMNLCCHICKNNLPQRSSARLLVLRCPFSLLHNNYCSLLRFILLYLLSPPDPPKVQTVVILLHLPFVYCHQWDRHSSIIGFCAAELAV